MYIITDLFPETLIITRKPVESVTKRTNSFFGHFYCFFYHLVYLSRHVEFSTLNQRLWFLLVCLVRFFWFFEITSVIWQEQRQSRKWLGSQNCFIDPWLLSYHLNRLHQARMLLKVNCTKTVPVVHSFKFHVFSKINIEENKLEVKVLVQSSVNKIAVWPLWPASLWEALHVNSGRVIGAGPGTCVFHLSGLNTTHRITEAFPLAHPKVWDNVKNCCRQEKLN